MKKLSMILPLFLVFFFCSETQTAVTVETINEDGLLNIIHQRKGNVLFLNVWATWCVPCKEEFPDLVKLADKYQSKGVDFIGVSADYADEIDTKIVPFLEQQKVNFPVYVQDFENVDALINSLNPAWGGAIPATFIYDAGGSQKAFMPGKHDYQQFAEQLDAVLNG